MLKIFFANKKMLQTIFKIFFSDGVLLFKFFSQNLFLMGTMCGDICVYAIVSKNEMDTQNNF